MKGLERPDGVLQVLNPWAWMNVFDVVYHGVGDVLWDWVWGGESQKSLMVNAALMFQQSALNAVLLQDKVLSLLHSPEDLRKMGEKARALAFIDSAEKLAYLLREVMES